MPPLAQHVLSRALRQEIAPDYVRQLILNDELPPPRERFAEWPWPVRVRALGDFAILRSEETLAHSRKPPRRLLALLKAIVALGGVNVPQNHVIDAVWPLADGDAAARSFEAAIHLRGLLGSPRALTLHEGMVSLNPELCWIDACEFEAALAPRQPSTEALEHALRLYRGDFFVNEPDLTIADPRRRALRAKFVLAQRRLAERRESKVGGGAAPSPRLRAPVASTAKREAHS